MSKPKQLIASTAPSSLPRKLVRFLSAASVNDLTVIARVNEVQLLESRLHMQGKQQRVQAHQILKHREGHYHQVVE